MALINSTSLMSFSGSVRSLFDRTNKSFSGAVWKTIALYTCSAVSE
ncbi:MAG: hypothetical protein ABFD14_12040 [Anaerolineaceae bacterium]